MPLVGERFGERPADLIPVPCEIAAEAVGAGEAGACQVAWPNISPPRAPSAPAPPFPAAPPATPLSA